MSTIETLKTILTSEVCFLCKAKVFSEEKIKAFGKSKVAVHSFILRATEVVLSVYGGSDLAAICRSRCYNRLLRYKDRVGEIENEIKNDFTNDARSESKDSLKSHDKSQRRKRA